MTPRPMSENDPTPTPGDAHDAPRTVPPSNSAAADDEPPRPVLSRGLLAIAGGDGSAPDGAFEPAVGEPPAAGGAEASPSAVAAESADVAPDASEIAPDAPPEPALTVDVADPDAEALARIPLGTRVEALLFATTEPLPLKRLRELTACPDAKLVREAVESLGREYAASQRAFRIEEVAQGFQLRTVDTVGPVVARLGRRPTDERISTAALETLAVVAYRQPVLRADVEKIRGVACGEVLRALQERGLVRVAGRAELPGSPLLYGTTQRFLEVFGLRDLQELPKDRELLRQRPE